MPSQRSVRVRPPLGLTAAPRARDNGAPQTLLRDHARIVNNIQVAQAGLNDAYAEVKSNWLNTSNLGGGSGTTSLEKMLKENGTEQAIITKATKAARYNMNLTKQIEDM